MESWESCPKHIWSHHINSYNGGPGNYSPADGTPLVTSGCSLGLYSCPEGVTKIRLLQQRIDGDPGKHWCWPFDPRSLGCRDCFPTVTTQGLAPVEHPLSTTMLRDVHICHLPAYMSTVYLPLLHEQFQLPGAESMTTPDAYSALVIHRLNPGHLECSAQLSSSILLQYNSSRSRWCFLLFQIHSYGPRSWDRVCCSGGNWVFQKTKLVTVTIKPEF